MGGPDLNRKLVLEAPVRVADGAGGFAHSWAVLGTLWAAVAPGSGTARAEGDQTIAAVSVKITVRGAQAGSAQRPQPGQRFRDGTRIYVIRAVTEADMAGRYLTCFTDEETVA